MTALDSGKGQYEVIRMDYVERLDRKFELVIAIFVLMLIFTTTFTGAIFRLEIDSRDLDDYEDTTDLYALSKDQNTKTISADREGLFLDIVDESEYVGKHTSIDIKEAGEKKLVYISYYSESSEALKIAQNDMNDPDRDWERWTIDHEGDVGSYSSLEVDGDRKAHIAYYDVTNTRLKYTLWCGENYSIENIEVIDDRGEVGKYTSLVLDGDDRPSVSYHDSSRGALRYAERNNGNWKTVTVTDEGENLGRHTSLALDSDSEPHISFYDWEARDLKYAKRVVENGAPNWKIQTIKEAGELVGKYSSLELDKNDRAHISCYEWTDEHKRLKYVTNSLGNGWTSEEVSRSDPSGTYTSLELYNSDNPIISYHEWGEENLRLAVKEDGEWNNVEIDTEGRVGSYTSLDYIGEAETHISYHDQGEGDLRHARYFFKNRTPLAPQSFDTRSEYGDVVLEWDSPIFDGIKAKGDHILGYHVYRSDDDAFEKIGNVTEMYFTDEIERVNETKTYEYRVAAVNRKGIGDNSTTIRTRARYFSYERSLEKANEYSILDEGLLPFDEDEESPYEVRWDLDYDPSEGPRWEDDNFKEGMYKKYDEVGLKRVLLEYENGNGDKRRCLQSAWVIGKFDLTSTYEESGSKERFFHLPEEKGLFEYLSSEDRLENKYLLRTHKELPYEYIEFEFLGENETVESSYSDQNKDVWEKTFNVSDSSRDTEVRVVPYLENGYREEVESPLIIPHEIDLKNEKEVEIINTPKWFPFLLDSLFGENLEIDNIKEDNDYIGWEVEFEMPEVDDEEELRDTLENMDISGTPELAILDDLERFFGGDYGFEMELFPDRSIVFDNDLNFETTLIEFYTDIDEGQIGIDTFDGQLGNSFDYAADPEIEVSAGISIDLIIKDDGISVSGKLELGVGAGVQIDIPLKSIGFAEVGLTAEIGGEIDVEYEVGALDYVDEGELSLDPGDDELPIEFLLNFGGGPYGEVAAGLARVEGRLVLEVIVGLELPSKDTEIDHSGRFVVEVSAGWGLWSKTEEWELYSTDDSTSMIRMDTNSRMQNNIFTTDRLATRDYGMNEDSFLLDSSEFEKRSNVGPKADPQIVSIDEENALAVWSELSKDDDGKVQSELFMQEFSDGDWGHNVHQIPTDGDMAYAPELLVLDDEMVLIYSEIKEKPEDFDTVEEVENYYTNDTLRGKSWDGEWSDLELNYEIENQAITNYDVDVDDQDNIHIVYRSGYPSLDMLESPPSEEGNIGVLRQDGEDWVKILDKEKNLPQSSRPSIEFVKGDGAIVYTHTLDDEQGNFAEKCYNQTVLVPLDGEDSVKVIETPNTTSHQLLSEENGKMVISWIENHTEIKRKVVGESWVIPNEYSTVHSNETVTGLSHHINETSNYYVFQKGLDALPTIVESSGDDWIKERSILDEKRYAANQIDSSFGMKDPAMVLVEKYEAIESWHRIHHRFDGPMSDSTVEDSSGEENYGELKGNWTKKEHDTQELHGRYGNYVTFEGEDSKMLVEHSSSLNVTADTEDFTVTALFNKTDYEYENYLMRKEGSWGVVLNEDELKIELWDDEKKHTISTGMKFSSDWTFFALKYENQWVNVTLKSYYASGTLEEHTEAIHLPDFGSLSGSIKPIKLAEGSGMLSLDDFRLVNRYLPNASIEKINRTSYPFFDAEYSVTTEKIPPYVNFTYSANPVVGVPVEFTAHSPQDGLNYSWSFEGGEKRYGEEIEYEYTETGYHTITLEAKDNKTGAATRFEKTIHVIDVNPPRFEIEPEINEKYEGNNSARIEWEEAEGESEPFEYRIHHETGEDVKFDHYSWRDSTKETFIVLEDLDPNVEHHLLVSVVNDVGLTNTSAKSVSFQIEDNQPPEFDGLKSTYVDHTEMIVGLRWHEADDSSKSISYNIYRSKDEEMCFEDTNETTLQTEKQIPVSEIGKHYFAVRAEDDEGNEDDNEKVKEVEVKDTEPPEIEIISPLEGKTVESPVTIEWCAHDNNSGISTYWVKRDNENWNQVKKQNYTFRNLPEGERTLTVKAVDNYNNSADDSIDLNIVAETTPEMNFYSPSPKDGAVDVNTDLELRVDVEHEDELDFDVSFYNGKDDEYIGTDEEVPSGETASIDWNGLEYDTTYEWYVIADDGEYENKSMIWEFTTSSPEDEEPVLKIKEPVGEGTVEIEGDEIKEWPYEKSYEKGEEVTLEALPDEDYEFNRWDKDYKSEDPKITFEIEENIEIIAYFEEKVEYNLTIDVKGEGSIDPTQGDHTYEEGTEVTVQARPAEGWSFEKWIGHSQDTEKKITVTIDADKEIVAVFSENESEKYKLTVHIEGEGSVNIDPDQEVYEAGTKVILTAEPDDGWNLIHWAGDIEDEDREEMEIKIDEDIEITAYFEEEIEKDEDSTEILAYIISLPMVLGIILIGLIAVTFSVYRKSDGKILQK